MEAQLMKRLGILFKQCAREW